MLKLLTNIKTFMPRIGLNLNKLEYSYQMKNNILFMLSRSIMSGEAKIVESKVKAEGMELEDIVKVLTDYAPLSLAESWDNVGLLIEPYTKRRVRRIMLTNDLAATVLEECMDKETDMIIAYHPPIFSPIKKFSLKTWNEKVMQCCLEKRIAVYSPHTSWDSIPGGICDWLASAFDVEKSEALQPCYSFNPPDHEYSIVVTYEQPELDYDEKGNEYTQLNLKSELHKFGVNQTRSHVFSEGTMRDKVEFVGSCKKEAMPQVYRFLKYHADFKSPGNPLTVEVYNRVPQPEPNTGIGRFVTFRNPITIKEALERVKRHTNVTHCRIAYAVNCDAGSLVKNAAVVPGSGGKVLANVKADLYVTGEMLHHDILTAVHNNSSVILTTHSDSERGFLKVFAAFLRKKVDDKVEILISEKDADPLKLY